MKQLCHFIFFILILSKVSAQADRTLWLKDRVWVYETTGGKRDGLLASTTDSLLRFFPGTSSEWKKQSRVSVSERAYFQINKIELHRRNGLAKGMLFGAGIGLAPVIISSIFGKGEGGAYVSVITLPIGIIAGAIIGGTGKRKFYIGGQRSAFHKFHDRIKY